MRARLTSSLLFVMKNTRFVDVSGLLYSICLQTCAHRYEKRQHVNTKQESRDIFGRCYVLSQNLRIEDEMDGGDWSFCDGRLRGHEKFGSCQQGVAATFTKDFHYIVFGAPGTYNWKGRTCVFIKMEIRTITLFVTCTVIWNFFN